MDICIIANLGYYKQVLVDFTFLQADKLACCSFMAEYGGGSWFRTKGPYYSNRNSMSVFSCASTPSLNPTESHAEGQVTPAHKTEDALWERTLH